MKPAFKSATAANSTAIAAALSGALLTANVNDAEASTIVLDFEQFASQTQDAGVVSLGDTIYEDGYMLTSTNATDSGFIAYGDQSPIYPGSVAVSQNVAFASQTLTSQNGGLFALDQISFAPVNGSQMTQITIWGDNPDLGTVSQTFNFSSAFDAILGPEFDKLNSANWSRGLLDDFQYDNIHVRSVSSVPIPASLPLLATGLAGLGALSRRKKHAPAASPEPK